MVAADPFGDLETRWTRGHPVVEYDDVGREFGHEAGRRLAVTGRAHDVMALETQVRQRQIQRTRIVVGDDDPGRQQSWVALPMRGMVIRRGTPSCCHKPPCADPAADRFRGLRHVPGAIPAPYEVLNVRRLCNGPVRRRLCW